VLFAPFGWQDFDFSTKESRIVKN